jgi:molecular chaperone HscB
MSDYFAVFGLPRKLEVDGDELRRRFYELSRRHHPDFHQLAGEQEQAAALAASALVNRAYRALRDPLARVEYLIALEEGRGGGGREGAELRPKPPMDLLEELLEVQEALAAAKASGLDAAARAGLAAVRQRLIERRLVTEADVAARSAEWDAALDAGHDRAPLLRWFKEALATRAYLATVIDDLTEALGEGQETHGAHRRH